MTKLADAYDAAADALGALANEIRASASPAPSGRPLAVVPSDAPLDPYEEPAAVVAATDHGSEALCPAHNKPFVEGQYGPYCPSQSDDPEWRNARGYCRITPKNVHIYLRKAAAAGKR